MEKSKDLYSVKIESFEMIPLIDDGVIEPQEEVLFTNFVISNKGGLSLPQGATLSIISKDLSTGESFYLTQIKPSIEFDSLNRKMNLLCIPTSSRECLMISKMKKLKNHFTIFLKLIVGLKYLQYNAIII
jgi:hypothetical protein